MEKERADVKRRNTLELLTSRSLSSGRITVMIRVMSIIYHRTTLHPTCLYNPCINSIQVPSVLESTCSTGLYLYFYLTTFRSNPSNVGEKHVGDVPLSKKIAAGFTTGALAIAVANPTDLVKVRLQSEGKLAPGVLRRYTGAMDAYAKIVRQEGVAALWTGLGPNVARNAIINAAELASYDQVKQSILKLPGFKDDVVTHILAGLGAGFFAICVGSLVDVVKSRMTQPTLVLLIVL